MESINSEIQILLGPFINPVKMAILFNGDETKTFRCLFSTTPFYTEGEEINLYDIPSLLRVLCLKRNLFSAALEEEFYSENMDSIGFVMEWTDHARKVIVFDLRELEHFETDGLLRQIDIETETLQTIFQKLYYREQQK